MKRIYTAVFRPWRPSYSWFGRDSGLVTEGLLRTGLESRLVVLQTPGMEADDRFLPVTHGQFADSAFWRGLELDAVVLQGGADKGIEPAARAIRDSGTRLLLRLDSDGVVAPQVDPYLYIYNLWWWLAFHKQHPALLRAAATTSIKLLFPRSLGIGKVAARLDTGHIALIETEIAKARLARSLNAAGYERVARKLVVLPIPVPTDRSYFADVAKEKLLVSSARWDDWQKDAPKLLMCLKSVLAAHEEYQAVIMGNGDDILSKLISRHCPELSHRIKLTGRLPHSDIAAHLKRARIFVCSSRAEGFPNAVAEAMCCGCSIAGPAEIASMHFFASHSSGSLAWTRRTSDLSDAVSAEIDAWQRGTRDPIAISTHFRRLLLPEQVAERIRDLYLQEN